MVSLTLTYSTGSLQSVRLGSLDIRLADGMGFAGKTRTLTHTYAYVDLWDCDAFGQEENRWSERMAILFGEMCFLNIKAYCSVYVRFVCNCTALYVTLKAELMRNVGPNIANLFANNRPSAWSFVLLNFQHCFIQNKSRLMNFYMLAILENRTFEGKTLLSEICYYFNMWEESLESLDIIRCKQFGF